MAKGKLIIEFDSGDDLRAQLWALLGNTERARAIRSGLTDLLLPLSPEVAPKNMPTYPVLDDSPTTAGAPADLEVTTAPAANGCVSASSNDGTRPTDTHATDTARGVLGKVGDGMSHTSTAEPPPPAPTTTETAPTPPSAPVTETVQTAVEPPTDKVALTPETLSAEPYEKLLEFVSQNPQVGLDASKCGPAFFRPMVEHKIKTFLTTIT